MDEPWGQMLAMATPEVKAMLRELGPDFTGPEQKRRMASVDSCSSDSEAESVPALAGTDRGAGPQEDPAASQASRARALRTPIDPPLPTQTLLHELIGINRLDKATKHLKKGADVNGVDCMGETPLFWALSGEAVDLLVSKGADISWRNNVCDCSAFYKFACQGKHRPLKALARHLQKVGVLGELLDDPASHTRRTPLHAAACNGFTETVKELMAMGADPSLKDYIGKTALDLARRRGFDEIADLLE